MQDSLLKQCTKCGELKPLTTDFYYRSKNTKCGFESTCKQCRLKDNENYRRLPQIRKKNYQRNYDKDAENKTRYQDLYNKRRKESRQKQIDIAMTSLISKIVSGKIKTSSTLELRCNSLQKN